MQAYQLIAGLLGDFNSHHIEWGYSSSSAGGDLQVDWASTSEATLLYDPKELHFLFCMREQHHQSRSGIGKMEQQPASPCHTHPGHVHPVTTSTISHHHPIPFPTIAREECQEVELPQGKLGRHFTTLLNKAAAGLPYPCHNNPNDAYDSYCKMLLAAAKKNIPSSIPKPTFPAGMMNVKTYFAPMQKHKSA